MSVVHRQQRPSSAALRLCYYLAGDAVVYCIHLWCECVGRCGLAGAYEADGLGCPLPGRALCGRTSGMIIIAWGARQLCPHMRKLQQRKSTTYGSMALLSWGRRPILIWMTDTKDATGLAPAMWAVVGAPTRKRDIRGTKHDASQIFNGWEKCTPHKAVFAVRERPGKLYLEDGLTPIINARMPQVLYMMCRLLLLAARTLPHHHHHHHQHPWTHGQLGPALR